MRTGRAGVLSVAGRSCWIHQAPGARHGLGSGAQHEECNADVLAGDRGDHERVEELVVAKHGWERIGPAARVDHRPGRMEKASHKSQAMP